MKQMQNYLKGNLGIILDNWMFKIHITRQLPVTRQIR